MIKTIDQISYYIERLVVVICKTNRIITVFFFMPSTCYFEKQIFVIALGKPINHMDDCLLCSSFVWFERYIFVLIN